VVVRARDAAGNASPDAPPVSVTVDTAAPAAPVLAPPPGPVSGTSVLLQGLAEPGATVTVLVEGAPAAVAVAAADGRFAVDLPLPGGDGTALIAAVARDAAGNASPASDAVAVTVDRTAPGAPSLTGAGGPTRAASLAVQGVAEPGATVSLRLDGVEVASVQALADGSFSADVPLPGADGAALVTAVALDAAGNAGPASQAIEVLVDRTAPGAPVLTWPAAGEHVQQGTVTLRGTAEPGATVTAWLAGLPVTSAAGPDGQFQLPIELAAGEYQLQLTATDAAGNVSPEAPAALTVLAGGGKPGSGCGCGTGAGGGPSAAALLALLALWPRRRRTAER
jgi:MYXO-CTERM domain-containing protein